MTTWPGTVGLPALLSRGSATLKRAQMPYATVSGETDAPEITWGSTSPNGTVSGKPGDLYMQETAGSVGATIWQKVVGIATTSGWTRSDTGSGAYVSDNYGTVHDNAVTDDTVAAQAVIDAAAVDVGGNLARVLFPAGRYKITSNPFKNRMQQGNCPLQVTLAQAIWITTKQVRLPTSCVLQGTNRIRVGIETDPTFICKAAITSVTRTGNVVTVVTATPHGLEVGSLGILDAVVNAAFNGGWTVTTVPTTTSFTFAMVAADTTSSGGNVFIPVLVLGDQPINASGVQVRQLEVNCNDMADSIGVYSNAIGELCGLENVLVISAYKYGIWFERHGSSAASGGPNNYFLRELEVSMTPNVAATGIRLRSTFGLHRGISGITLNTSTNAGTMATGMDISGVNGFYDRIHGEHCTNLILIGDRGDAADSVNGRDSAGIVIANVFGISTVTTLVRLRNFGEVHDIILMGLVRLLGTNTLVDEGAGITLTDDYVTLYAIGGVPTSSRYSTSPNVPWTIKSDITLGGSTLAAAVNQNINAAAGQNRQIIFQTGGVSRWILRVDNVAEGGANAGSGFALLARDDAGAAIDTPLQCARAAGSPLQTPRPIQLLSGSYEQLSVNSPAQIVANQNDYAPGAFAELRLTTDASRNITGFANPQLGRILTIINAGAQNIVLQNQNAGSTALNRIITGTGADMTLTPDQSVTLHYDNTTGRWRVVGRNF